MPSLRLLITHSPLSFRTLGYGKPQRLFKVSSGSGHQQGPRSFITDGGSILSGEWVEKGMVLADIPGLLEGAHEGIGLGMAFLRHVQRCRVLIHVVNGDSPDPVGDYQAINQVGRWL